MAGGCLPTESGTEGMEIQQKEKEKKKEFQLARSSCEES